MKSRMSNREFSDQLNQRVIEYQAKQALKEIERLLCLIEEQKK
jgi:hypothetical protein